MKSLKWEGIGMKNLFPHTSISEFGVLRRGYYLWAFGSCLVRSFTQDASVFAACTAR